MRQKVREGHMVNEEKIRLMTKAASYEAGEGKKALSMNKFFRGDYISLHLISAWISFTVAFCLCAAFWAFYKMEYLMNNIHRLDLASMGRRAVLLYVCLLTIFLMIHYIVYHERYQKNKKSLAAYNHILNQLSHIYRTESKSGSEELTAGGAKEDEDFTGI